MDLACVALDQNPWWEAPRYRPVLHLTGRRSLFDGLYSAIVSPQQNRAQILLGPRQVGKSTLLLQIVGRLLEAEVPPANITFFDFSDDRLAPRSLSPRSVVEITPPGLVLNAPRYYIFDEITWAKPGWDRWLKQAIDSDRRAGSLPGARFVLTSSSASLLVDASLESGQGRWDNHFLEGMTFSEYERLAPSKGAEPTLRYLRTSGYPGQLWEEDPTQARKRLREDIIDRAILHDLLVHKVDTERVRTLFTYLIQTSGNQWEAKSRGRDLDTDPRSVSQWLRLLQQTGLISVLPRWTPGMAGKPGKASTELRAHPKVFASDHGLVLAFSACTTEDPQVQGRVFETVVYRHLRSLQDENAPIAYFRTNDRHEIDFVASVGGERIGLEVTSAKSVDGEKLAKVAAAGAILKAQRLVVVYGGLLEDARQGIRIVPLHRFLADPMGALLGGGT